MKFAVFSILFAICAFAVDLGHSSVESRLEDLDKLKDKFDELITKLNSTLGISSTTIDETINKLEEVANQTKLIYLELEETATEIIGNDEDTIDPIDVNTCLDKTAKALTEILAAACKSSKECGAISLESILIEINKYKEELTEIQQNITKLEEDCSIYQGYLQEICLYCKTPQYEITLTHYEKVIERLEKKINNIVNNAPKCLNDTTKDAEKKIEDIKKETTECLEKLCSTTPESTTSGHKQ